jgi:hydrogenase maturation protease
LNETRRIGVLGIGNVLMGDDGVGPYTVKLLEARYKFPKHVELQDVGTPGLGITSVFSEYAAVILIDAVNAKKSPGEVKVYRKDELVLVPVKQRISPHDPALVEALLFAELSGKCPKEVLLVGVVPETCELKCGLSATVRAGVETAIGLVLVELEQLGAPVKLKARPDVPRIWWEQEASKDSLVEGLAHVSGHPG